MKAMVLVERIGKQKYRASTAQPIGLESEGRTRNEAVKRLRELIGARLARGELLQISIPGIAESNPWVEFAGIWKEHPDFDAFRRHIVEYRKSQEALDPSP